MLIANRANKANWGTEWTLDRRVALPLKISLIPQPSSRFSFRNFSEVAIHGNEPSFHCTCPALFQGCPYTYQKSSRIFLPMHMAREFNALQPSIPGIGPVRNRVETPTLSSRSCMQTYRAPRSYPQGQTDLSGLLYYLYLQSLLKRQSVAN